MTSTENSNASKPVRQKGMALRVLMLSVLPWFCLLNGLGNLVVGRTLSQFPMDKCLIFFGMFVVAVLVAWWALSPHWAAIPEEQRDTSEGFTLMSTRRVQRFGLAVVADLLLFFVTLLLLYAAERLIG
jgi:hypothetical protein